MSIYSISIKLIIIFSLSILISACQSTSSYTLQNEVPHTELYLDDEFISSGKINIESEQEIFALDDEMKEMVNREILRYKDPKKRAKLLLKQLFSKEDINLAYQNSANLTARQAYRNQSANCLSLTIMAYALAKEANLDVNFQEIKVPEYWVRNGQYNMLTGHVNLALKEPRESYKMIVYQSEILQIDFDPEIYKRSFPKKFINKNTVIAMFYNNKGAENLVSGNYSLAYAYFKKATFIDPSFSSAWGNLAILYKLKKRNKIAKKSYELAIALDPNNLTAISNLSRLLRESGEIAQSDKMNESIHNKRYKNPYYHGLLAEEAFYNGANDNAIMHYKKAISMNRRVHEFYFGIAKVYLAQNDHENAQRAMNKAITYNRVSSTESQYIAKLNLIIQASNSAD
ncbi:tetratricopeptide repeat protein [Colwelliaceae bacterium 6441]